ncbi:fungal-specific transcription factor domain-containing protein [Phyllosticta citrichinensis]|uniref:Fungal-specific transcription factor domain-containing protein n=1 Tax=Phyllosticta citrichinensis TaxID=1130410 RepID=A0ABR1XXJ7_9PEZI
MGNERSEKESASANAGSTNCHLEHITALPHLPLENTHNMKTSPTPGPRTNSLAFAKTDCFSCAAIGRRCDRLRPLCHACLQTGTACRGFPTTLSWQHKRSNISQGAGAARNAKKSDVPSKQGASPISVSRRDASVQSFKFVTARPWKQQRKSSAAKSPCEKDSCSQSPGSTEMQSDNSPVDIATVESDATTGSPTTSKPQDNVPLQAQDALLSFMDSEVHHQPLNPVQVLESSTSIFSLLDNESNLSNQGLPDLDAFTWDQIPTNFGILPELEDSIGCSLFSQQAPVVPNASVPSPSTAPLYKKLFYPEKVSELLNLYDREFCSLPLTHDIAANPFRVGKNTSSGSKLLLNAILALSSYHLSRMEPTWQDDAHSYKESTDRLLQENFADESDDQLKSSLLDAVLTVFTLESAQSAFGFWPDRLKKALKILNRMGIESLRSSSRLRAQTAMLLWWDSTIALISRRGLIFPSSYLSLLAEYDKCDEWSFFQVSGCSLELVLCLTKLGQLAVEKEIASMMNWVRFEERPIDEIESTLEKMKFPDSNSPMDSEEDVQRERDNLHCTEAWRNALLLYSSRVFRWDRQSKPPAKLSRYARIVLDHTKSCRRTSTVQKQLLLPVFLAGVELSDSEARGFCQEYCQWWSQKCRYEMFSTVSYLLHEFWEEKDKSRDSASLWWGSMIDRKTPSLTNQFLFG